MSTTDNNYVEYDRGLMRSCIYGLAVGDALGVPYEFSVRGTFKCTGMVGNGTHRQYAGTWSDDTSMGVPAKSYDDCGNGSLMRTAPLAMLDPIEPYDIREVSAITHAHPVAEWSCVTLCDMLRTIRNVGTPAKVDLWHRYGYIASRPVEAVKKRRLLRAHARGRALVFLEHELICRLRTYRRQFRRRHRYDGSSGRCHRGRVLRLRGHPAEVGRPVTRQSRNRSMYLGRINDD